MGITESPEDAPAERESAPSRKDAPLWELPDPAALCWRELGAGEFLLFNPRSGQTHFLGETAREVLDALAPAPATLTELLERLDLHQAPAAAQAGLERMLGEMDLLGLIRPRRPGP
ncbi:MAG: HPr-rel-A system PqqD family peptide chaperone [Magnetococcus sp. WYHC-3]